MKIFFTSLSLVVIFVFFVLFFKPSSPALVFSELETFSDSNSEISTSSNSNLENQINPTVISTKQISVEPEIIITPVSVPEVKLIPQAIIPFISQAPLADWSDPRQQDGCEEAAAIMAMAWVNGETKLDKTEARDLINQISDFEQEKYGEYRDVHVEDVLNWVFKDWFKYDKVRLVENVSLEQIKKELALGNIILAPTNGQALKNPNFKDAGPERHMLVIKFYDEAKQQFVTNDPGTRLGESYRYDENLLYEAIRVYPTGYHKEIIGHEKTIIVVEK